MPVALIWGKEAANLDTEDQISLNIVIYKSYIRLFTAAKVKLRCTKAQLVEAVPYKWKDRRFIPDGVFENFR